MRLMGFREAGYLVCAAALLATVGCASSRYKAPVEDRVPAAQRPVASTTNQVPVPATVKPAGVDSAKALPGIENAGKPGYYTVKPGDNLIRIALDNGHNWRDVARWNGLDNPNRIEVGQVLRVVPPHVDAAAVASSRPVPGSRVDARPLEPGKPNVSAAGEAAASAASASTASAATGTAAPVAAGDDDLAWIWPASGSVSAAFDEQRSKGLGISGKAGDAVLAAADGRVMYAGAGLRGYGNLVIIKHNNTYLSAYAHNQSLLVKEDQVVKRGQKIAEMGSSDSDTVKLHFEIRKQGKPVDPSKFLPPR